MPSATTVVPGNGIKSLITGLADWDSNTMKLLLFTSSASFNKDTTDFLDDVRAQEETGTNWAADGQTLSGCTVNIDTTNDEVEVRATDVSVGSVTLDDGKFFGVFNFTPGTDATRPIICYGSFDTALAPQGGTLLIDFNATEGLFKFGPY